MKKNFNFANAAERRETVNTVHSLPEFAALCKVEGISRQTATGIVAGRMAQDAAMNAAWGEYDPAQAAYWAHLARAFAACAVQYGAAYMVKGVVVC